MYLLPMNMQRALALIVMFRCARVGGILLHRNFTEGTEVKAGEVLFEIDPAPYEAELEKLRHRLLRPKHNISNPFVMRNVQNSWCSRRCRVLPFVILLSLHAT